MLTQLAQRLVAFCVRWRWGVLVAALAMAVGAAAYAVQFLQINTDVDALFDDSLPFRQADTAYDRQFPADIDLIVAVIDGPSKLDAIRAADRLAARLKQRPDAFCAVRTPEGGPFFAREGLLYLSLEELDDLSARLAAAQPLLGAITADRSARGLFRMMELGFEAARAGDPAATGLAPAVNQAAEVIAAIVDGTVKPMNWSSLLGDLTPSGGDARAFVLAQPRLDMESLRQGGAASALLRQIAVDAGITPGNGYRLRLTGTVPLSDEEFATVQEGTGKAGIVALVLVTVLLFAALGSLRLVTVVVTTLIVGFFVTVGWATLSVGEINLISVAFAVMFVGIAVDFGIQFCLRFREEFRKGAEPGRALSATGGIMVRPLLLAATATALGFFAFLPTDYRGVAQLGMIAGGGVIVAVGMSFTLLPALVAMVRGGILEESVGYLWAAPLNRWLVRKRAPVLITAGLLAILALAELPRLTFDFDPLRLKDPATESMSTVLDLMGDPWATPNVLNVLTKTPEEAHAVADKLAALPQVRETLTIFDFVPLDQDDKLMVLDDLSLWLGPTLSAAPAGPPPAREDVAAAGSSARDSAKLFLQDVKSETALRGAAQRFVSVTDRLLSAPDGVFDRLSPALVSGIDEALKPLRDGLQAQLVTVDDLPEDLRASWISQDGRYRVQALPQAHGRDVNAMITFLNAVRAVEPDAMGPPVTIYETGRMVTNAFASAAAMSVVSITILLFVVLRHPGDVARVLAPPAVGGGAHLGHMPVDRT